MKKDYPYIISKKNVLTMQGRIFKGRNLSTRSQDGLGEWKSKTKSREQTLSVKVLDKLLENSLFDHDAEDKKGRKNIEKISYFNSRCMINNAVYNAIITVKKVKNYGDKYYHHYLEDIKTEPRSGITRPTG
jgi:hypothetical protein